MPRVAGLQHSRGWHRASHRHYAMAQILLRRVYRAEGIQYTCYRRCVSLWPRAPIPPTHPRASPCVQCTVLRDSFFRDEHATLAMCLPLAPRAHTTHSPSRVTLRAVHGVARFVFQRWTCHATRRARKRERLRDSADWNAVRLMSDCLRDHNDPETFLAGDPAEVYECVLYICVHALRTHPFVRLGSACFLDVLFRTESVEFHGSARKCKSFGTKFANVQRLTKRKPRSSRWSIRCEHACTNPVRNPPFKSLFVLLQETETFASLEERFEELQKAARKSDCVGEAVSEMILFLKSNPSVNSQDKASKKVNLVGSIPSVIEHAWLKCWGRWHLLECPAFHSDPTGS